MPHIVALVNAIIVFATFTLTLPSMIMRESRLWLQLQGWMVIVSGVFTLVLGLVIWVETLRTRAELNTVWGQQTTAVQSLLQQRVSTTFVFCLLLLRYIRSLLTCLVRLLWLL